MLTDSTRLDGPTQLALLSAAEQQIEREAKKFHEVSVGRAVLGAVHGGFLFREYWGKIYPHVF